MKPLSSPQSILTNVPLHPILREAISLSTNSKRTARKLAISVPKTLSFLVQHIIAEDPTNYTDVSVAVGFGGPRNANRGFAAIGRVLDMLRTEPKFSNDVFPDPTSIVTKKNSKLGGQGVFISKPGMKERDKATQLAWLDQRRQDAFNFGKRWLEVLSYLEIEPLKDLTTSRNALEAFEKDSSIQKGEGAEHLALKNWVANNSSLLIRDIRGTMDFRETEHLFWSLDRLDVFIRTSVELIGFEIKPSTASSDEIRKGLYQVMKYQALLRADLLAEGSNLAQRCFLVLGGRLPSELRQLAQRLGVEVVESTLARLSA